MPFFNWNKELCVGIELFDAQHMLIIGILNELHEAVLAGAPGSSVAGSVAKLALSVKTNFAQEERLMAQARFSGLEAHQREHAAITRRVEGFIGQLNGEHAMLSIRNLRFFINWLAVHIQKTDKKFAAVSELQRVA